MNEPGSDTPSYRIFVNGFELAASAQAGSEVWESTITKIKSHSSSSGLRMKFSQSFMRSGILLKKDEQVYGRNFCDLCHIFRSSRLKPWTLKKS